MRVEFYQWIRSLAVFYILLSSFLHLVPDGKYEKYIRFFMGLLLIFMMCTPVFALLGKAERMAETFRAGFSRENFLREQEEFENMERMYLEKGYAAEMRKRGLEDGLYEDDGPGKREPVGKTAEYGTKALGSAAPSGASAGSGLSSCFP